MYLLCVSGFPASSVTSRRVFGKICFCAILWSIWLERNQVVFRNKEWEEDVLVDSIKTKVAIWTKACYDLKEYLVSRGFVCVLGWVLGFAVFGSLTY
ncbi:hypothetical protein RHMOL_Rhmol04G0274900 [Rhododendron molle]|uniref:Uncharacterized protein n=1 Tax=Rhododendron molle TaxID=49168 RepID=A0ACC0P580_RHOML|nr:hypothetical protein RHMOL_Rhmol04G0274900 [Rhododendron molle]